MSQFHDLACEMRPREFHARVTRRGRSVSVFARRTRKLALRRFAVIMAAIGVPAMAAPEAFTAAERPQALATAPTTQASLALERLSMASEQHAPMFEPAVATDAPAAGMADAVPPASGPYTGPKARPVLAAGTSTDRYRAGQCLAMAAYYEAASEGDDGMRAVAQVVLNRVSHPAWPNTVCGVVFQGSERSTGCQFSFTCDGSMRRKPSTAAWLRARRVADRALAGNVFAPVGLATHYHTLAVHPYWASSLKRVTDIGFHRFYSWRGPAGTRAAFASLYRGAEPAAAPKLRTQVAVAEIPAGQGGIAPVEFTPVVAAPQAGAVPPAVAATPEPPAASGTIRPEYARSGQWLARP